MVNDFRHFILESRLPYEYTIKQVFTTLQTTLYTINISVFCIVVKVVHHNVVLDNSSITPTQLWQFNNIVFIDNVYAPNLYFLGWKLMVFPTVMIKTMPCHCEVTVGVSYLLTENMSIYIIATNWSNLLFLA